ncbi:MAG: PKD domain-containing protein [Nitrososphaera sp.]
MAPATFEFEAQVTGGMAPYTISWDFGDGRSSEEGVRGGEDEEENDRGEHVEHTFEVNGTYNARVSVTDTTVRTASDSIPIIVDEPPPLRSVDIISNATAGIAPATFEFEANVTGGIEPYTYRWNFGDGSIETDDQDEQMMHTFDLAGRYNVSLIVMDATGRTVSDKISITVETTPSPPLPPPLRSVDIISNATTGIAPATFEFEANVTGGIEPYTYRWNFGDGSAGSNTQTVLHTFDQAGRYIVPLIVTDSQNHVALDRLAITVEEAGPPPSATTTAEEGEDPTLANQDRNSGTDGLSELDAILNNLEQK